MTKTLCALCGSAMLWAGCNSEPPGTQQATLRPSAADEYTDPPPNAPPAPAMCGDMNGGGDQHVDFESLMAQKIAEKPEAMERQLALLEARYDLSDNPHPSVTMSGGKPVQRGVRVQLPDGISWGALSAITPEEVYEEDLFPRGFMPLPHPKQPEGGMLFPHLHIEEVLRQTGRDLTRFDLEFDLPDQFLPEFPAPIFLTTRPELGDVSQGQLVTIDNYFELFKCLLNPKQLDGLRLLVTPFAQQQFNLAQRGDLDEVVATVTGQGALDCHPARGRDAARAARFGIFEILEFDVGLRQFRVVDGPLDHQSGQLHAALEKDLQSSSGCRVAELTGRGRARGKRDGDTEASSEFPGLHGASPSNKR
jgi:cytochrome c peroxidase